MAKIKLTKSAVDAAQPQAQTVELWDTLVPGFLCKIIPSGRKVFMLQYRTNAGERRKPALGQYRELTVEQARSLAQEWQAQVRRGGETSADKAEARKAPTVEELCNKFMEDHSKKRNKPSIRVGYQGVIDRCIIPLLGRKKVHDVKRPDITGLMEKFSYKQTKANKAFSILRKMFNRKLRRLVAVELKVGEFKAAYKGQMELYLRWLDKHEREPEEASPLGIILCTSKKREQIELLELDKSGIHVAEYLTALPPRGVFVKRLQQATRRAQLQIQQDVPD